MDDNKDTKQSLTSSPYVDLKRQLGRTGMSWIKTV